MGEKQETRFQGKLKMEEELSLNEKRKELFKELLKIIPTKAGRIYRLIKEQDKEFIKRLKEEIEGCEYKEVHIAIIDKLAGEKLTGKEGK